MNVGGPDCSLHGWSIDNSKCKSEDVEMAIRKSDGP